MVKVSIEELLKGKKARPVSIIHPLGWGRMKRTRRALKVV